MSDLLKSNDSLTRDIAEQIKNERDKKIPAIGLSGETNLRCKMNLQDAGGESGWQLNTYREAGCLYGISLADLGDTFEEIDNHYAIKQRGE